MYGLSGECPAGIHMWRHPHAKNCINGTQNFELTRWYPSWTLEAFTVDPSSSLSGVTGAGWNSSPVERGKDMVSFLGGDHPKCYVGVFSCRKPSLRETERKPTETATDIWKSWPKTTRDCLTQTSDLKSNRQGVGSHRSQWRENGTFDLHLWYFFSKLKQASST